MYWFFPVFALLTIEPARLARKSDRQTSPSKQTSDLRRWKILLAQKKAWKSRLIVSDTLTLPIDANKALMEYTVVTRCGDGERDGTVLSHPFSVCRALLRHGFSSGRREMTPNNETETFVGYHD